MYKVKSGELKFDIQSIWELLLLGGACQVGLFEALKTGHLPLETLADRTGSELRSLWTVVEALIEAGYLVREGAGVGIDPGVAEMLYDRGSPRYTGFSFMHGYDLCRRWIDLPDVIKTGKPVKRERKGEDIRNFIASMAGSARQNGPLIAAECLQGLGSDPGVLDAGGGPLTYARAFAGLGARVTVFDLPEVVEMTRFHLEENETIVMVPGDMTVSLPEGPYDLVYLGNVCHIFDGAENSKIMQRAYKVIRPGGRIAIQDFVRGVSPRGALFAVNMLINTPSGGVWSMQQYSEWLSGAGFGQISLNSYGDRQLIMAVKAL
ncbi:MAG: methyltransferase domain-containing protein [Actinobacteria bacterium]|nr:methyltransferase domain-containing protein [Actinomycetota bacterium]